MKNLIDTAIEAGKFKNLIKIIHEAGFTDILNNEGPFTIFAPTDEAFSKLSDGTIDNILQDKEKLTEILTYHVISDKVMSGQVKKIKNAKTVNGKELKIDSKNGVKINKATVTEPDIECSNGVIHIIDKVLIPN